MSALPPFEDPDAADGAKPAGTESERTPGPSVKAREAASPGAGAILPKPARPMIHPMYHQPPSAHAGAHDALPTYERDNVPPLLDDLSTLAPTPTLTPKSTMSTGLPMDGVLPYPAPVSHRGEGTHPGSFLATPPETGGGREVHTGQGVSPINARNEPHPNPLLGKEREKNDASAGIVELSMPVSDGGIVELSHTPGSSGPYDINPPKPYGPSNPAPPRSRVQQPVGDWSLDDVAQQSGPKVVPQEIAEKPWNWGAFLLTPVWCAVNGAPSIGHLWDFLFLVMLLVWWFYPGPSNVTIALLLLTSSVGVGIFAGIRGNVLAWQNGDFDDVADFDRSQRTWSLVGAGAAGVLAAIVIPVLLLTRPATPPAAPPPTAVALPNVTNPAPPPVIQPTAPIATQSNPASAQPFGNQPQYPAQRPASQYPTAPAQANPSGQYGGPPPLAPSTGAQGQPGASPWPANGQQPQPGNTAPPSDNSGQQGYPAGAPTAPGTPGGPPPDQSGAQPYPDQQSQPTSPPPSEPSTSGTPDYGGPPPSTGQ